ncbi:MAG TPA: condensation domain-containing protein, partial [Pseudonocardiaceae bacterium]|nr:condensation domain-containing protein [Pseudonocardiaceae bacterium]
MAQKRAERFEMDRPPLLRCTLVYCGAERHWLVLTIHHIVADGWSEPIMHRELLALYAPGGSNPGVPPLPKITPYRDYYTWLSTRDHSAAQAAWQTALAGLDEPTRLAAELDGAVPDEDTGARTETVHAELPEATTAQLLRRGREHGLTLGTIVQGAWGLLLGRLIGRCDVVFGSTVSGRDAEVAGIESMVGLFLNTLPVRVRWRPEDPLAGVLARLQDEQSALLDHQHLGLADIQRAAGLGELFDTLVVVENYPVNRDLRDNSGTLRILSTATIGTTHYPLVLIVAPGPSLDLRFEYDTARLGGVTVRRLAEQLVRMLEAAAADPGRVVAQVDLLAETERVRAQLSGAQRDVPTTTLAAFFEAQVCRTPETTAVIADTGFGTEVLSYAELNRQADALAQRLRAREVGPERIVAVAVARSPQLLVALLGVLKAGAAYLPVDVDHPADRIAFILSDSGASLVVTTSDVGSRLPEVDQVTRLLLGSEPMGAELESLSPSSTEGGLCPAGPDHAAYLMYTSGSTGRPKGVLVTHRAVLNQLGWVQEQFGLEAGERVLHQYSAGFDPSVQEIFAPLSCGGTVVVAEPGGHRDPLYLARLVSEHRVTT